MKSFLCCLVIFFAIFTQGYSLILTQKQKQQNLIGIQGNCQSLFEDDTIFSDCQITTNENSQYLDGEQALQQLQDSVNNVKAYLNKNIAKLNITLKNCPGLKQLYPLIFSRNIYKNIKSLSIDIEMEGMELLMNQENYSLHYVQEFNFYYGNSSLSNLQVLENMEEMINLQIFRFKINKFNNNNQYDLEEAQMVNQFILPLGQQTLKYFNFECIKCKENFLPLNQFVKNSYYLKYIHIVIGISKEYFKAIENNLVENNAYFQFTKDFIQLGQVEQGSPSYCRLSSYDKTNCTLCFDGRVLRMDNRMCIKRQECQNKSSENFAISDNKCLCNDGYILDGTKCVKKCQQSSDIQQVNYQGICTQCQIKNCKQCDESSPFICIECKSSKYILNGQACITNCPEDYFVQDNFCLQECPIGFYEDYNVKKCFKCDKSCKTCQNNSDYCTSCNDELFLFFQVCTNTCPEYRFYPDTQNNECRMCDDTCLRCKSQNFCYQCEDGLILSPKNTCIEPELIEVSFDEF